MPRPKLRIRYTTKEAADALLLRTETELLQYAEAAGIELGRGDSLSEAQVRTISAYIDEQMVDCTLAAFHAAQASASGNNGQRRRGGLRPEAVKT